jgi:hypothetical protein
MKAKNMPKKWRVNFNFVVIQSDLGKNMKRRSEFGAWETISKRKEFNLSKGAFGIRAFFPRFFKAL